MITCAKCQVQNSVDSKFCKSCGTGFDQVVLDAAQAEFDDFLSKGYEAFHEGRTEEAALVADHALQQIPDQLSALSLKGMALERQGHIEDALAIFERIVELNPDSALDKIKVQQLRNVLTARILAAKPEPNKSRALAGAAAAMIFVFSTASALYLWNNSQGTKQTKIQPTASQIDPNLTAFQGNAANPNAAFGQTTPNQQSNSQGTQGNGGSPTTGSGGSSEGNREQPIRTGETPKLPKNATSQLPEVGMGGTIEPVRPPIGEIKIEPNKGNPKPEPKRDPDEIDPPIDGQKPPVTTPKPNNGVIDMKVSTRKPGPEDSNSGTSKPSTSSPWQTARNLDMMGKNQEAIQAYEQALASGADPAAVHQQIARCYDRMGQRGNAANSYRKAASILESRVANGGSARDQKALETCRQALKVLGG